MILCFSGTGNSRYVADILAERLSDHVVDIAPAVSDFVRKWGPYPSQVRQFAKEASGSKTGPSFVSDDGEPFILVCPVYAWRIPEAVSGLVETADFIGADKIYVVASYGDDVGNADVYAQQMVEKAGLVFGGFTGVLMPSTYAKIKKMPTDSAARAIRAEARSQAALVAERIKNDEFLEKGKTGAMPSLKSGAMHRTFRVYEAGSKHFVVSKRCSRCGRCELFCPVNDIKMTEDGIEFGKRCISCYACIHRCPDAAIDVKDQSEANGRYICPSYREEMEDLAYEDARQAKRAAREAKRAQQEEERRAAKAAAEVAAAVAVQNGADPELAKKQAEAAAAATLPKKKGGRLAAKRAAMQAAAQAGENAERS